MSSLLVIKGPNIGVRYDLGERTRIGRLGENEIQVADANVSRVHAEIVKDRMSYTIYDRESKNGILVNGEQVTEKALLRNDEILIGHTLFVFNSDLNIRNAKFSNNSVYLYPSEDETLQDARQRSSLQKLGERDREAVDFVMRFAELFSGPVGPLAETAERLMTQVHDLFHADGTVLMLKEPPTGDLRPLVALPALRPIGVSRELIHSVLEEKNGLLSSEHAHLPPMQNDSDSASDVLSSADMAESPPFSRTDHRTVNSEIEKELAAQRQQERTEEASETPITTLCVPILQGDDAVGVLVVEKAGLDCYSLRDLGLLQAIARMAGGHLDAARLAERELLRESATQTPEGNTGGEITDTRSLRMQEILNAARRSADSNVTIMISGETGTGKELLAHYIHRNSPLSSGPFVAVNCGAIPENLFESELFGYEKGAFTGAYRTTAGKIEAAQGGTLFLDEIGELGIELQPKLLRFLQDRAFYRVGGTRAIHADVRIIAATNVDLAAAVRSGDFREDLWYRLNVVPFHMPPLRERREDIGQLVDYLIARYAKRLNRNVLGANDGALALLQKYDWPGNIRELENAVERAVLLAAGRILTTADFAHIEEARRRMHEQADLERKRETRPLTEVERQHIIIALKKFNFNQAKAAEALGLHRNTLRNKIIEYGIEIPR